ncbi:MAG: hypothetical protein H0U15_05135 [Geodermatophilaceae bacterium]|nr:hypothetical protein [Geodermatophilaceae bacterium]
MSQSDQNDSTAQHSTGYPNSDGVSSDPTAQYAGPPQTQGYQPPQQESPSPGYSAQGGYSAPPGYPPNQGFPAPGYPASPGYPSPYGYPPYGYPMQRGPVRPGAATASAVLMFIQGGIVLFSTLYVLFFASLAGSVSAAGISEADSYETEFTIIGLLQLVSVGLLIFAGVQLLGGSGRTLAIVACGLQLAFVVYWMIRIGSLPEFGDDSGAFFFVVPLFYAVLPVVALPLAMGKPVGDYIAAKRGVSTTAF